ncbi:MAG TPA: formate dehydrogenase [Alphaproteobacteria bacterium]|nr:formate dehydrogenase [Alphaproteobacteria bacterium]
MDRQPKATSPARRAFLKTAGLGAGAAAASVAGAAALDATPADAARIESADGYRETAHVKRFYDLAKKF